MPDIGDTLRDARMRAHIDVSEIEAKTKIRAKYLRALENEEWSLLPGPTFVKSFLRTYAQALGLDGKALVEQYRMSEENPSDALLEPIATASQRARQRAGAARAPSRPARPSRAYVALVGFIVLIIALLVYGLASGGSGGGAQHKPPPKQAGARARQPTPTPSGPPTTPPPPPPPPRDP